MTQWSTLFALCCLALGSNQVDAGHKVILMLLDGFRHDYFSDDLTGFQRVIQGGVKAERLIPSFPSVSFTNYYSIATGLYPESHGMISNFMYDPAEGREFLIGTQDSDFDSLWWDGGEPIWVSSEIEDKKAMMFFWLGCQSTIRGYQPSVCYEFTGLMPSFKNLTFAINETVERFAADEFQFSGIYYGLTDKNGHAYGPASPEVMSDVRDIDGELNRLLDLLEETDSSDGSGKLKNTVSLIIVSDHGMASVGTHQRIVLSDIINKTELEHALRPTGADVTMQLWPKEGAGEKIYEILSKTEGLTPYWKHELPARWHFANNPRVPLLTVVADEHYLLLSPTHDGDPTEFDWNVGTHGYDNNFLDVSGIFLAVGPAFKSNHNTGALNNIEVYQMICRILDIPASPNNGTWSKVQGIFEDDFFNGSSVIHLNMILTFVALFLCFLK